MRNVGTHRTLGRVLLGQFMRNIRYAMIVPSTTIVKVIAVQIVGLLVALGAAVEEPDRETFWEVTSGYEYVPLLRFEQSYPSPFAIFLSVAIWRKKSLIG